MEDTLKVVQETIQITVDELGIIYGIIKDYHDNGNIDEKYSKDEIETILTKLKWGFGI